MKAKGNFFIKKDFFSTAIIFTAVSEAKEEEALSFLNTIGEEGICNYVQTQPGNRRCGLAKYLMATCFQDPSVLGENNRGVDVTKSDNWDNDPKRTPAYHYCETVTSLLCDSIPYRNCISYMRAASLAEFDILFTKATEERIIGFELGEALESKFDSEYEEFIRVNGGLWFFCKCKDESKNDCMAMASNTT